VKSETICRWWRRITGRRASYTIRNTPGIIAYWPLDDWSGVAHDAVGTNHGAYNSSPETEPRLTIPEAATALGLAASTLRLQVKLGKLKGYRMGGRIYVTPAEVARYAENHRRPPKET